MQWPLVSSPLGAADSAITTPKEFFGFNMGDDYCLANYRQLAGYWSKLESESPRLKVVCIGATEEGRPQLMGIVTSPANHRELGPLPGYRPPPGPGRRRHRGRGPRSGREGKAVVWIDGGLHASEIALRQMLIETLYQFVSASDAETLRILDDCHHSLCPRQPRRHGPRRRLVHARARSQEAVARPACRGSIKNTSATTTTATSTPTRRPKRRT